MLQRFLELFGLHRVGQPHAADDFGREAGNADEGEVLAFSEGVANPQRAVIGNADDVDGDPVFLAKNEFYLGYTRERAEGIVFSSVKDVKKKA